MSYWGNIYEMDAPTNIPLNSTSKKLAMRFTVPMSKTFDVLYFYVSQIVGSPGFYKFGLQATVGGIPTGVWLCSSWGQFLMPGIKIYDLGNVPLVAGTVYVVVIEYYAGTVDATNYASIGVGDTNNFKRPYDCSVDNSLTTLLYDGASWNDLQKDPCFLFMWTDVTTWGIPYYLAGASAIYGNYYRAERFTPPIDMAVNKMGMWIIRGLMTNQNLTIILYNITDGVELASIMFTPAEVGTTVSWIEKSISELTLLSTKEYRIYAKCPGAPVAALGYRTYYNMCPPDPAWYAWSWNNVIDRYEYSINGGAAWITENRMDLPFRFALAPPPPCEVKRANYPYYLDFARRVFMAALKFSSATLESEKESLKQEYILRGLQECALEQIIVICQAKAAQVKAAGDP